MEIKEISTVYEIQHFAQGMRKQFRKLPDNLVFDIIMTKPNFESIQYKLNSLYNKPKSEFQFGVMLKYNCHGIKFNIKHQ